MKVLQINVNVNSGSTGRIAEEIGNVLIKHGHESYIAYGRGVGKSNSKLIRIGNKIDNYIHGVYTLITDKHGFASKKATIKLITQIEQIKPDLIALHNLHGYYIHIGELFKYLKVKNIPVVWTLFDCWAFTGHCTYFDDIDCKKWISHCSKCPKYKNYPSSWVDNSLENFKNKKQMFTSIKNLEIITHSNWLSNLVKESFLQGYKVHVTPSAINLSLFKPVSSELKKKYNIENKKIILGCASSWTNRKGYNDFIELSTLLSDDYKIVMIGLNKQELKGLPANIIGLNKTESIEELAQWYSLAYVFVNPTSQDNFPTTNIEALACGTPVITYNTGGSPEAIDENTGIVVKKGDVNAIVEAVNKISEMDYNKVSTACRKRAEQLYDKDKRYLDYIAIFEGLIRKSAV
ncbi:MAG: glycosyltransferase [Bacteroidia bacterium]